MKNPFQKYICIKQHDEKDCGAACLATITKQYGLKLPISKIRDIAGTDKQGTNVYGLVKAAKELGFTAKGVKGNSEAFFEGFPLPAIAHVVIDQRLLHYVVIHRTTKSQVIVADPAKGIVKYTPEEFFQIWTGVLVLMVPTPQFQKGDEIKGLFSRFLGLIVPHKSLIIHITLASVLITVFGVAGSFYFQFLVDEILPYKLHKTLHIVSIGLIIMYLFKVLLTAFRTYLLLHISQKLSVSMMLGYYSHVLKLPIKFFGTRKVGEIISRFMDASKVTEAISSAALTVILDTVMILIVGGILYYQNSALFFVTILLIPFYIGVVWLFIKPYEKINRTEMEENAQLTAKIVESINGIETVKAYTAEEKVNDETEKLFVKYLKTIFKHGVLDNTQSSLKNFLELVGGAVILWVGSFQVLQGNLSAGQLITFNALLTFFLDPLQRLINLQPTLQSATVAAERLGEILEVEPESGRSEAGKIKPSSLKGTITFKDIDFRYGTRELVLNRINIKINSGEKVALVGESGSGKTTLVKLLMNFYACEKGEILIDDNNIQDIDKEILRSKIAYIPQSNFFFSGSIRENLCLGIEGKGDMERIVEVAKLAKAHDFINKLPARYETLLEENGSNLSGGQKQRLAIARAMLKEPDILIMDEATSNLDTTTEKAISNTIQTLTKEMTTIIIAHRLSTIKQCDKIYVFDKGTTIEVGTHSELMAKRGKYYELWKDQLPNKVD